MMITNNETVPHANFLDMLFASQGQVGRVFKDILGLYEIGHIAISHIDKNFILQTFSSTPSLEFNLFNSHLWSFDKTYQSSWYNLCNLSPWTALYSPEHYDELYYLKQIKHDFPIGISFAVKLSDCHIIYSIASHSTSVETQDMFANQHDKFYKIGQYCSNLLLPLFSKNEEISIT